MSDTIRLTIPATPPMLLVARMALAGFCSQCGSDTDTLEDVRTLSDEACYCLMHQQRPVQTLSIEAGMDGGERGLRPPAAQGYFLKKIPLRIPKNFIRLLLTFFFLERLRGFGNLPISFLTGATTPPLRTDVRPSQEGNGLMAPFSDFPYY